MPAALSFVVKPSASMIEYSEETVSSLGFSLPIKYSGLSPGLRLLMVTVWLVVFGMIAMFSSFRRKAKMSLNSLPTNSVYSSDPHT